MLNLDNENFLESVKTGQSILVFYKDQCPLYPSVLDIFNDLQQMHHKQINFFKIDAAVNSEIIKFYDIIIGVPTILALNDSKVLSHWPGLRELKSYHAIIDDMLN